MTQIIGRHYFICLVAQNPSYDQLQKTTTHNFIVPIISSRTNSTKSRTTLSIGLMQLWFWDQFH